MADKIGEKLPEFDDARETLEDELIEEFTKTVAEGTERLHRTWRALIVTGLFGGIDVALGIMAMLAVYEATESKLLAGAAFGIGLFALKMAHSELFTEEFLLPINAIAAGQGTWWQLVRLWGVTLATNLAGGWMFTWVIVGAFPRFEDTLIEFADGYMKDGFTLSTAMLALLAGFTITLLTRMGQGSSEGMVAFINSLISGFLVVGLGMLHGALNSVVIFAAMHAGSPITYLEWAGWAAWVVALNMLGGLLLLTFPRLIRTWELSKAARERTKAKAAG